MADTITGNSADGLTRIEAGTPLTRLHFFDGKYLRADALTLEQDYHRELVRLANLAGGWGVVHGLGVSAAAGKLSVSPGLAITPTGRTVLLNGALEADIGKLVGAAAAAAAAGGNLAFGPCGSDPVRAEPTPGQGIYEILVGPAEALCDTEPVYGKLCEEACVTDSEQPYWREGVVLRLKPVALALPTPTSVSPGTLHLRNRVASAYFAAEPWLAAPLLSRAGLASPVWCNPAALYGREEVPLGLLVREGEALRVLDAWSARRERMDAQARGYWQGRMRMRPWNVFLAQILQFQCQLGGLFANGSPVFEPQPDDDCARLRALLEETLKELEATRAGFARANDDLVTFLGANNVGGSFDAFATPASAISALTDRIAGVKASLTPFVPNRLLISGGFFELPPAGYLPTVPGPLREQLQRMFGEGVDITLRVAPLDHLGHLLEEAQHMDRISLTRGLDDPAAKEAVEVFVPDGRIVRSEAATHSNLWEGTAMWGGVKAVLPSLAEGGLNFPSLAGLRTNFDLSAFSFNVDELESRVLVRTLLRPDGTFALAAVRQPAEGSRESDFEDFGSYLELHLSGDPFAAAPGTMLDATLELREARHSGDGAEGATVEGKGSLAVVDPQPSGLVRSTLRVTLSGARFRDSRNDEGPWEVALDVSLARQPGMLTITGASSRLSWGVVWSAPPRRATLEARSLRGADQSVGDIRTTGPIASDDPRRRETVNVLGTIGKLTLSEDFAARAEATLFADAGSSPGSVMIEPTRDFVMFRRRRQVECAGDVVVPAPRPVPKPPEPDPVEPGPVEPAPVPEPARRVHRLYIAPLDLRGRVDVLVRQAQETPDNGLLAFLAEVGRERLVRFTEGEEAPVADDVDDIRNTEEPVRWTAVHALVSEAGDPDQVQGDHKNLMAELELEAVEVVTLRVPDFGDGALGATIVLEE